MRVIFMGTPDFAIRALSAIMDSPHEVVAVYTQPPRPSGRGQAEKRSPVHELALELGIPVYTPKSLRGIDAQKEFSDVVASTGANIAVVVAYGLILPAPVLKMPPKGCINIHGSLLPRWRGAAPIHRAILAGDTKSGITIMQMDEGLDTGPMLLCEEIFLGPAVTAMELHDRLAILGARMVVYVLHGLEADLLESTPQPTFGVNYAKKLTREEGRLDWQKTAEDLASQVRAFTPWPGAWFEINGTRIKVDDVQNIAGAKNTQPGEVLDGDGVGRLTVACGVGSLRILSLQRAGKKKQSAAEFLRGFPVAKGLILELLNLENPEP
ncbi:MAG: methionyl-tRNA formyltransferase [Alphaproteobacteria bacterium]